MLNRFPAPPPCFAKWLSRLATHGYARSRQTRKSIRGEHGGYPAKLNTKVIERSVVHRFLIMVYVYILESIKDFSKHYVGITNNVNRRLTEHNKKPSCSYTAKDCSWILKNFIVFDDTAKALKFEIYLKSYSGKSFLKKYLL